MNKKQQALDLYSQTDLTKTQIASMLGLHRNTLSTWVQQGHWDRLKAAGQHLPSILAENCYHIMGHLTEHYLSEFRATRPITHKEADTLYKLAGTISKLRARATINESMEILGYFLDKVRKKNKKLAAELRPHMDEYLSDRAKVSVASIMPPDLTAPGGRIPAETPEQEEERQREIVADNREAHFSDPENIALYKEYNIPIPPDMLPEPRPKKKERLKPAAKSKGILERPVVVDEHNTPPLARSGGVNTHNATRSFAEAQAAHPTHDPCTIPAQKMHSNAQQRTVQLADKQPQNTKEQAKKLPAQKPRQTPPTPSPIPNSPSPIPNYHLPNT